MLLHTDIRGLFSLASRMASSPARAHSSGAESQQKKAADCAFSAEAVSASIHRSSVPLAQNQLHDVYIGQRVRKPPRSRIKSRKIAGQAPCASHSKLTLPGDRTACARRTYFSYACPRNEQEWCVPLSRCTFLRVEVNQLSLRACWSRSAKVEAHRGPKTPWLLK